MDKQKAIQTYLQQTMTLAKVGEQVWDAEAQEQRTITGELVAQFTGCYNKMFYGQLMIADAMTEIYRERLYIAAHYHSRTEFVEKATPYGLRQARNLVRMGEAKWLILNALQNLGMTEEQLRQIGDGIHAQDRPTQLAILTLPPETAAEQIQQTWIDPAGRELEAEEVIKLVGKDLREKLKGRERQLAEQGEELKAAQAELAELQKIASGETTVAQETIAKLEKLQIRYDKLRGQRERSERGMAELQAAREQLKAGYETCFKYMPRDPDEFDGEQAELLGEAAGLCAEYVQKLDKICRTYGIVRAEYEG